MIHEFENAAGENGAQELVDAVSSNNPGRVRELLESGVRPDGLELAGEALVIYAAERRFPDVVRAFIHHSGKPDEIRNASGQSLLGIACLNEDEALVRFLEGKGADVNAAGDFQGWRPLHFAAVQNSPSICRFLIDAGADVDMQDDEGRTARDIAQPAAKTVLDEVASLKASNRLHKMRRTMRPVI